MRVQTTRAAELETLSAFRQFIGEACGRAGIDDEISHDLQLAVDEACTNVIEHGYAGMNPGSIMLALEFLPDQITVEITDFGRPFEPTEPDAPDPQQTMDDPGSSGFGLYFIYQTMDEIRYRSGEDGNLLTFIKQLSD